MSTRHLKTLLVSCCATFAIAAATQVANAADLPSPAPPVLAPIVPGDFNVFQGIEFHAQGEIGIIGSPSNFSNGLDGKGINYGSLYEDHLNEPQLNQILLTVTKPIDPKATGYAFGFTGQAMYGSDMRFNHYLGIDALSMGNDRNQLSLIQAFVSAHLPWFTSGGVDVKAGLFSSPQGFETLDPSTNPFYSHSYTYNYAVTFNHTGILTTTHVNDTLDIWLGIDTGNQTTFGYNGIPGSTSNGDDNAYPAGFVGFGLNNIANGKLTILALSHIGPEAFGTDQLRYYNDVVLTYKINDDITSVTELNYTHDSLLNSNWYSGVENLSYGFGKIFTLNGRGEIASDGKGALVSTPLVNNGLVLSELGTPGVPLLLAPGTTTYGELTLGITIKPDVPKPLATVLLRPEIRYDRVLDGAPLYGANVVGAGGQRDQFTFGGDLVAGF